MCSLSMTPRGCGVKSEKCDWPDVGLGEVGCCFWVLSGCGLPLPRILFCILVFLYSCIDVSCILYLVTWLCLTHRVVILDVMLDVMCGDGRLDLSRARVLVLRRGSYWSRDI